MPLRSGRCAHCRCLFVLNPRKTWGYIQRTVYGVGYEVIAKRFKHGSPAITMRYLGIQDQEVYDSLMHDIG